MSENLDVTAEFEQLRQGILFLIKIRLGVYVMKVLVEIFDGKTVRGMLVDQEELASFVPNTKSKTMENSRLPNAPKWERSQNNRNGTRRLSL